MGTEYARVSYVFLFVAVMGTIVLIAYPELFQIRSGETVSAAKSKNSDYLALIGLWIWVASPYIICAALVKRRSWQLAASRKNLFGTVLMCSGGVGVVLYAALYSSVQSDLVFIYTPLGQWFVVLLLSMF